MPGDSDAASAAASDADTDGGGVGGVAVWEPLAEEAPAPPGREWVAVEAGMLPADPQGFFRLVLRDEVGAISLCTLKVLVTQGFK